MAEQGRSSILWRLYLLARCSLFTLPWLLHLTIANVALSALLPISVLFPSLSYNISSYIAASVWRGIQFIFNRVNQANLVVSGDKLPRNESAILVSNHVEWTDFYMIQELAIRAGMLGRCRWFAKKPLRWVPLLGWGLWAMGMPLVSRKWTTDQNEMNRVFRGVLERRWPMWLISYSEGTRYTAAKRREAEQWSSAHDKRLAQHTLYPRTKGFIACVQKLRSAPQMKAVYDVTVAYAKKNASKKDADASWIFQQAPSFGETLMLPRLDQGWRFFVHVDRYAIEDLPRDDEKLAQWLEERWLQKGERLEDLRRKLEKGLPWEPF